jgi:hypothetical protein
MPPEIIRDRAPIVSMEGADNQIIGALSLIKEAIDKTGFPFSRE